MMDEERLEKVARLNELWFKAGIGQITEQELDEGLELESLFETGPRLEIFLQRSQQLEALQEMVDGAVTAFKNGLGDVEALLKNGSLDPTPEGKQFYLNEIATALGFNISTK